MERGLLFRRTRLRWPNPAKVVLFGQVDKVRIDKVKARLRAIEPSFRPLR